jgi:lactoylglutathione lyase
MKIRYLHTMVRVKDLEASLAFFKLLGLEETRRSDYEQGRFTLIFLAPPGQSECPVELTHNWGTEADPDFKYHDGNAQPQGFGHICFSVPDLDAATAWFDQNQVVFVKRPDQGKMKDVAFIKDPDGYWIEIVEPARLKALGRA